MYDKATSLHYNYNYQFVRKLAGVYDVMLFVERAGTEVQIENVSVTVQKKTGNPISTIVGRYREIAKIRKLGYDTFYVHQSFLSALVCSMVTRRHGGKTFYWHCGLLMPHPGIRGYLRFRADKFKLWFALHSVDHLVTGTNRMSSYYQREFGLGEDKIKLMPNWVDPEILDRNKFALSPAARFRRSASDRIIMYVHDLSFRKGGHLLPEIVKKVCSSNANAVFVIIGDGIYKKELEKTITENSLQDRVFLVGSIPNTEIPSYLAGADLFIMPSLEEGFPRVLLEAMSMNVPFVATDVGGVLDIVPPDADSVRMVESRNADAFADAVLEEVSKRHTFDLRGWIVGRYDGEKVLDVFTEIIR